MKRLVVILLVLIVSLPAQAQLFKPFTSLRVIKTEYFDIIFPAESEISARVLASYADSIYDQISSILDIEVKVRIPVTFAPHTDLFNGYYNSISSPHIVLFDTPMDLEWTVFEDNLKGLFIHELVHAISFNTRGSFFNVFHKIFGNWVSPALINAPLFMVEGVTISFESLSGFGRSNDPLVKQKLRQVIFEDKFPTPFQVSGVYDYPGQRGNWYEYGGVFSSWLIDNYGMEKYSQLWQAMGQGFRFSFSVYRSGFYSIFKKIYDIDFLDAWSFFRDFLVLDNVINNPNELLPAHYRFLGNSISALAAGMDDVYILNSTERKIYVYNIQTKSIRNINTDLFRSYDLDISAGEKFALVSGYNLTGERYSATVTEHEIASGRRTGRTIQGLYKARYFRDGVIGIRSELHNTCIVFEKFNGEKEILFRGNEGLLFSGPQAVDDERIMFIAARNGVRELLLYNYVSKELFRIESTESDNELWRYMRNLGVSEGKIFFSHNINDRMYKLAFIDLDTMNVVFSNRDFSGGIFNPVSVRGYVYYKGAFFSGDSFLCFPEAADSLSGTRINLQLVELDNLETSTSIIDLWQGSSTRYRSISYMNPFNYWVPLPLIRHSIDLNNFNFNFDGAGLFSVMMDPTDRNLIMVTAYADINYRMAMIDNFSWQTTVPGFPLTIEFSDKVIYDFAEELYRDTRVYIGGSINWYPGRWGYGFSFGAGYVRSANNDGSKSAYQWEKTGDAFFYSAGFSFSNQLRRQYELFGNGLSLNLRGISLIGNSLQESFRPRIEGILRLNSEARLPLNITLYGAYDHIGMNLHGVSRAYGQPLFDRFASKEYQSPSGLYHTWLAGGEISAGIFSVEIQNNLSHLYFNRFYGILTLRSLFYDSKGHEDAQGIVFGDIRLAQSLVLKLGLLSSIIPVKTNPVFIEPYVWGAFKFSNAITGEGSLWEYGFNFSFRY